MPGPANKKKRKNQAKNKNKKPKPTTTAQNQPPTPPASNPTPSPPKTELPTPPPSAAHKHPATSDTLDYSHHNTCTYSPQPSALIPDKPFIYDPGNGPRVRDTRAFLASKFFSQPPAWDNPLCAEFAQEEVLEMIQSVLSEELALILWYNKSRATSRICPACQRLYRVGDSLPEHMAFNNDENQESTESPSVINPRMLREQEISGICSPVCFILAAFNYPGAIQSAWGRMGDEMDDDSWSLLNGPGDGTTHSDLSQGLVMKSGALVKIIAIIPNLRQNLSRHPF